MNKILYRYILGEIWPIFLASLFISIFVVATTRMLSLTEMVVSHGARLSHVFKIFLFLIPEVLIFSFPAASLISVLVAFLRLSADNEIIALKASGISFYQILPPVIFISFIASLISFFIAISALPWGNRSLRNLLFNIIKAKADIGIKERVFCEPFKDIIFYVNHFSVQQRIMYGVFVVDKRDKTETNTIVAEKGELLNWPKKNIITLHFINGTIFSTDEKFNSIRTIQFNTYDLNLEIKDITSDVSIRKMKPKEMGIKKLLAESKNSALSNIKRNLIIIELMERFSIPIGVFLMGLIGAPLGTQIKVRARSIGVGIGLIVFFIYYMCLVGAKSICETGFIPPVIGMWIPNIFLLVANIYFIRLSAKDKEINIPISKLGKILKKR